MVVPKSRGPLLAGRLSKDPICRRGLVCRCLLSASQQSSDADPESYRHPNPKGLIAETVKTQALTAIEVWGLI